MSCTCAGACCATFPIAKPELMWDDDVMRRIEDGAYIRDMLVAIPAAEAHERSIRFGGAHRPEPSKTVWFRCRHWNEDTRLCTAYESRPHMCRDYPYNRGCEHPPCTYDLDLLATLQRSERLDGPIATLRLPA